MSAETLAREVGVQPACNALGVSRATFYRRRRPSTGHQQPRPTPARALSGGERKAVLETLSSDRFVDRAPAEVVATLLDEQVYLCSERTMYRILAAAAPVRERRNQRRHPVYEKPELVATAPNRVWSWDITKLKGPQAWTGYYLYVLLDIFSRYVVGWMIADRENTALAKRLIEQSCENFRIEPGQLTLHSDRGSPMTSHGTAQLLARLSVTRSLKPAPDLQRQSFLRGSLQNAEVPSRVPCSIRLDRGRTGILPRLLHLVQRRPSTLGHRHAHARGRPLRPR